MDEKQIQAMFLLLISE